MFYRTIFLMNESFDFKIEKKRSVYFLSPKQIMLKRWHNVSYHRLALIFSIFVDRKFHSLKILVHFRYAHHFIKHQKINVTNLNFYYSKSYENLHWIIQFIQFIWFDYYKYGMHYIFVASTHKRNNVMKCLICKTNYTIKRKKNKEKKLVRDYLFKVKQLTKPVFRYVYLSFVL